MAQPPPFGYSISGVRGFCPPCPPTEGLLGPTAVGAGGEWEGFLKVWVFASEMGEGGRGTRVLPKSV